MIAQRKTIIEPGYLPNSCQYTVETARGPYLVQIAWPLCWTSERLPQPNADEHPVSSFYLVDGNAYFLTAVEISRRLECLNSTRSIVVGIGYPNLKAVYDFRRGPDLTPRSRDGKYEMPLDKHGKPRTDLSFGEAHLFLDFIKREVMQTVEGELFPSLDLASNRKGLFGHSYGGLFSLNALFTQPGLFDFIAAASPSISWSEYSLVSFQEEEFHREAKVVDPPPVLLLTWGSNAEELEQRKGESDASFTRRRMGAEEPECGNDARAMAARLAGDCTIKAVLTADFPGWGHGGAAVVGLQRALMHFLLEMD
ncbi:related to hydrolase of the alpha/beta superfamily [Ramularia collo-cygni]|uniref:Related to hydrolase of the alpha/beta superfamily n=1 Tax=Ramularia collo-cygni TaxID=112498 RepID=A0A2D3UN68_9PEZI|nr:related to hydrolase of the alpha/beta superfamily [Ramularia collo-cygni]CZT16131.1 related to hydrolase of the alpha/beta superfamily [Ramularia collo-cygni]